MRKINRFRGLKTPAPLKPQIYFRSPSATGCFRGLKTPAPLKLRLAAEKQIMSVYVSGVLRPRPH